MSASIVLTGLAANDPIPGTYLEINYAQGESGGASIGWPALIIANKTSAGSASVETLYGPDTSTPCQTEADVITLFGTGSPAHRMWLAFTAVNKKTAVYFIINTASGGASGSVTLTVTNAATGNGTVRVWCGSHFGDGSESFVDVPVTSGQSANTIASNISTYINTKTRWPVTASPSTNTVVITAKVAGPRGNLIKVQTLITSGITTTVTGATTLTALSGGGTADSYTNVLAAILARRFFWIIPEAEDATLVGAVVSQVNTQAAPTTGIRQRVVWGSIDTISNTTTIATGRNAAVADCIWQPSSEYTPAELAAYHAGLYALLVSESLPKPLHNFCNFPAREEHQKYWKIQAPRSGTGPTSADITSALNNGITPIAIRGTGSSYLVRRITSRSLNGSNADYRVRDSHKVDICIHFGEDAVAKTNLQFGGKDIADDPAQGQRVPGPDVVTPRVYAAMFDGLIDTYDDNDQLQNAATIKADKIVQRESSPRTRMSAQIPLQPIDIAAQFAVKVLQVA